MPRQEVGINAIISMLLGREDVADATRLENQESIHVNLLNVQQQEDILMIVSILIKRENHVCKIISQICKHLHLRVDCHVLSSTHTPSTLIT